MKKRIQNQQSGTSRRIFALFLALIILIGAIPVYPVSAADANSYKITYASGGTTYATITVILTDEDGNSLTSDAVMSDSSYSRRNQTYTFPTSADSAPSVTGYTYQGASYNGTTVTSAMTYRSGQTYRFNLYNGSTTVATTTSATVITMD